MKPVLAAYSTENSAAVGVRVLLEPNDVSAGGGYNRRGRAEQSGGRFRSRRGKTDSQHQGESVEAQWA